MRLLVSAPGISVRHCEGHGLVNVTIGGTTLHLERSDFDRVAAALADASLQLAVGARDDDVPAKGDAN